MIWILVLHSTVKNICRTFEKLYASFSDVVSETF